AHATSAEAAPGHSALTLFALFDAPGDRFLKRVIDNDFESVVGELRVNFRQNVFGRFARLDHGNVDNGFEFVNLNVDLAHSCLLHARLPPSIASSAAASYSRPLYPPVRSLAEPVPSR